MAKTPTAPNPKANVLRSLYGKLYPAFKRAVGEVGRVRVNPAAATKEVGKAQNAIASLLVDQLERTKLPVVTVADEAPAGEHWLVSGIESARNVLYARNPLTIAVAYVAKDGTCPVGAIYMPQDEICVIAEAGVGVSAEGFGRFRCANRLDLDNALAMLPVKTVDVVTLRLMEKLDAATLHTRKSGNSMADIVDVAMGAADVAIATRVNRLEALLTNLIMGECGGFASDLKGKPLGPDSETMVVGNPKIQPLVLKLLA